METNRLEAFSDGVFAIIITIMVLEMKVPHDPDWSALQSVLPAFLSYVLSFIYVGIYWNNHHHLLKACPHVTAAILWANLHLLFWLSLLPFVTGWMGENHFTTAPSALYGSVLLCAAGAYYLLQNRVIATVGCDSQLAKSIGPDFKGKLSPVFYALGVLASFIEPWISGGIYVLVAIMWFIPDRRLERVIKEDANSHH